MIFCAIAGRLVLYRIAMLYQYYIRVTNYENGASTQYEVVAVDAHGQETVEWSSNRCDEQDARHVLAKYLEQEIVRRWVGASFSSVTA